MVSGSSGLSIPLTELLLRPSTLRRFTKRGFESTDEIEESRANGGINLLASELDVSLQEAAGLIREVQGCLGSYYRERSRAGGDPDAAGGSGSNPDLNDGAATFRDSGERRACIAGEEPRNPDPNEHSYSHSHSHSHSDDRIVTAYDWLHRTDAFGDSPIPQRRHIVTFCRSVDDLLGGGIEVGQVTEISGLPGTGKTQLATQLAVLARLPRAFGGVEGKTLYVDAEGSFAAERAMAMAVALCKHVEGTAQKQRRRKQRQHQQQQQQRNSDADSRPIPADFTTEGILDSIDVFRVHDETALLATLYSLERFIERSSPIPVRLVVIDSIAFHFRAVVPTDSSYYLQRTKTLVALASHLGDLARKHDLAVVAINQMTTKLSSSSSSDASGIGSGGGGGGGVGGSSVVVPALGESWAHATATRLVLSTRDEHRSVAVAGEEDDADGSRNENANGNAGADPSGWRARCVRTCSLIKSSHRATGSATYRILEEGIRDAPRGAGVGTGSKRPRPN